MEEDAARRSPVESEPERPSWLDDVHAAAAPVRSKSPPIAGRRAIAAPNSPDSPGKSSALTGQKLTALKRRQDLNRRSLSRTSSASALDASDAESDDLAHAGTQPTTRTAAGRRTGQVAPGPSHSLSRSVPSGAGVGVGVGGGGGGGRVQVWDFLEHDEQVAEQGTVAGEGEFSGASGARWRGRCRLEGFRVRLEGRDVCARG